MVHAKIKIYKTVLIYGHESWYSTVTLDKKFLVFENKVLPKILGIKLWYRASNERLREITGVQSIDDYIRVARWKLLGHVYRF